MRVYCPYCKKENRICGRRRQARKARKGKRKEIRNAGGGSHQTHGERAAV